MNEPIIDEATDDGIAAAKRRATLLLTGLLGSICGLVVFFLLTRGGRIPDFSQEDFEAAQQRWSSQAPPNYEIEISVSGRQSALYRVEVEAGQVKAAFRNEKPLKQRRTMGTWSVPGMFDTMSRDVDNRELTETGKASRATPQLTLRCQFHPVYGFPQVYQRVEHRKFGSNMEVSWRVKRFEVKP